MLFSTFDIHKKLSTSLYAPRSGRPSVTSYQTPSEQTALKVGFKCCCAVSHGYSCRGLTYLRIWDLQTENPVLVKALFNAQSPCEV